jgi:cation diffusion facilitator CzcD-associated flavoprotein CzcO
VYGDAVVTERVETVVIGAGQAGLATSAHLTRPGGEDAEAVVSALVHR